MGAARLGRRAALLWLIAAACGDGDRVAPPGDRWQPAPGTSWQWQLSGDIDTSLDVAMYDVDLFETPDDVIAAVHARGAKLICCFSAGSYEPGRPDSDVVPDEAIGLELEGWPGERWYDVRHPAVLALARGRLDRAVERGCDGVEPDNVDAYANPSGFALSGNDQLTFNRALASEAHARGLSIGLKNDLDQVARLVDDFDWALNEQCFEYEECDLLAPFIDAGKAVFTVEYGEEELAATVCPDANARDFDTLIKNLDLDAWRIACR